MEFKRKSSKPLSVLALIMINVIAIDSLRNLPFNATYGYSVVFMYILGALCFLIPCALITAELSTRFPQTGGSYIWVRKAFGPGFGFMNTWLLWIYNVIWFPTILSFIAGSIAYLINPAFANDKTFMLSVIIIAFLVATWLNVRGIQTASWISIVGALLGTIIPMLFIIGLGLATLLSHKPLAITLSSQTFFPSIHHWNDFSFVIVILFSLFGIELAATHAGDVTNPRRDFPKALLISSIIIVVTEAFASLAIAISMPKEKINLITGLNQAFAAFLQQFHLQSIMPIAVLLIIVGGFAGMSAWVLGPARSLMVAAKDGCAPRYFSKTNRHNAPVSTLIAQAVIVILLCTLFLTSDSMRTSYWILSDLTAQVAVIYYIIFFAAAIKLKHAPSADKSHYTVPGGKAGTWVFAVLGILTCLFALILGFLPPSDIKPGHLLGYEMTLSAGILICLVLPVVLHKLSKRR